MDSVLEELDVLDDLEDLELLEVEVLVERDGVVVRVVEVVRPVLSVERIVVRDVPDVLTRVLIVVRVGVVVVPDDLDELDELEVLDVLEDLDELLDELGVAVVVVRDELAAAVSRSSAAFRTARCWPPDVPTDWVV